HRHDIGWVAERRDDGSNKALSSQHSAKHSTYCTNGRSLSAQSCLRGNRFAEVFDGEAQAGLEVDFGFPAEQVFCFGDVGAALFGIVLRKLLVTDVALGSGYLNHAASAIYDRELLRIANVYREVLVAFCEAQKAFNFIAHVTETARLSTVAVDGKVFAAQRLLHKIGNDPAIVQLHAATIGVEDAHNTCVRVVIAVIGHSHGFGKALGLVINRAGTDRIHIAPVGLLLRMLNGVAVAL